MTKNPNTTVSRIFVRLPLVLPRENFQIVKRPMPLDEARLVVLQVALLLSPILFEHIARKSAFCHLVILGKSGSMSDVTSIIVNSAATGCLNLGDMLCGTTRRDALVDPVNDHLQNNHDVLARPLSPLSAMGAANEQQCGEFLSDLIAQLWPLISAALAVKIQEKVEPRFATLPGPLATLRFVKIDLGTVPMRLDNVVVHELQTHPKRTLQFDMDCHWDGNCDIQLKANILGQLGVKRIKVFGRISILLGPLHSILPIVQGVQVAFINPPKISLEFSGLANIADVDMIRERIYKLLQKIVRQQMVLPQRRLVKVDMACRFFDIYEPPVGVVRLLVMNGTGFVIEDRGLLQSPDIPDCYVLASVGDTEQRSLTIKDNTNPVWNERMDFILCDYDQIIHLDVYDEDAGALDPDDFLGMADTTVGQVLLEGGSSQLPLQDDRGKLTDAVVNISCERMDLTDDLTSLRDSSDVNPNQIYGLLTILIGQAFNLPFEKEDVAARVEICCGEKTFTTKILKDYPGLDSLNPFFDSAFHLPLTSEMILNGRVKDITFNLFNKSESLGIHKITHEKLAGEPGCILTEKSIIGSQGAAIEYRVILRGITPGTTSISHNPNVSAAVPTSRGHVTSRSNIRITVVKAHGFKVQRFRRLLRKKNDVADPYCVIKYGSK